MQGALQNKKCNFFFLKNLVKRQNTHQIYIYVQVSTSKWTNNETFQFDSILLLFLIRPVFNLSLSLSPCPSLCVSAGRWRIDSRFDGWPPVNSPSPSPLLSILPSPPLSVPLLWLSLSSPCITQRPLGRPGQGAGLGGQTQKQSTLCHSKALPLGPCPSGRGLSAELGLLISC